MDQFGRVLNAFVRSRVHNHSSNSIQMICVTGAAIHSVAHSKAIVAHRALALISDAADRTTLANLNCLRKYSIFGCCPEGIQKS